MLPSPKTLGRSEQVIYTAILRDWYYQRMSREDGFPDSGYLAYIN